MSSSAKPDKYVFDHDGDTELILSTCRPQLFNWDSEKEIFSVLRVGKHSKDTKKGKKKKKSKQGHLLISNGEIAIEGAVGENSSTRKESLRESSTSAGLTMAAFVPIDVVSSVEFPDKSIDVQDMLLTNRTKETLQLDHSYPETSVNSLEAPQSIGPSYGETAGSLPGMVEVRVLVSRKHLMLASPYFRKMLSGSYVEGSVVNSHQLRQVSASDWDPDAFDVVLNIVHGYHRSVPKSIDLPMLAKIAIIVDYYACHERVEVYVDIWLAGLESKTGVKTGSMTFGLDSMLWLLVSWVFSRTDRVQSLGRLALENSARLIQASELPIPFTILVQIDELRQEILDRIFTAVYELLDRLQVTSECSYECSSMLLGSLIKQLVKNAAYSPRITRPFDGVRIKETTDMIKNFQQPRWRGPYCSNGDFSDTHSCSIQQKLATTMNEVGKQLRDFKFATLAEHKLESQ